MYTNDGKVDMKAVRQVKRICEQRVWFLDADPGRVGIMPEITVIELKKGVNVT